MKCVEKSHSGYVKVF